MADQLLVYVTTGAYNEAERRVVVNAVPMRRKMHKFKARGAEGLKADSRGTEAERRIQSLRSLQEVGGVAGAVALWRRCQAVESPTHATGRWPSGEAGQ